MGSQIILCIRLNLQILMYPFFEKYKPSYWHFSNGQILSTGALALAAPFHQVRKERDLAILHPLLLCLRFWMTVTTSHIFRFTSALWMRILELANEPSLVSWAGLANKVQANRKSYIDVPYIPL